MDLLSPELGAMHVLEILRLAREKGASDVHLADGQPPGVRIDGDLAALSSDCVDSATIAAFLTNVLDRRSRTALEALGTCDAAAALEGLGTLRIHVFRAHDGLRCSVRLLPASVPPLESLDLPGAVETLASRRDGLVLIVGPTGSGKTTLLAAILDRINRRGSRHIVTLEDPIEYLHQPIRSMIAQCEVGRDVSSFAEGLRGLLRADPDAIAIGELRDPESMQVALAAAETGHLVLASLHTSDAAQAVDRMIDAFPVDGRDGIRVQIAQTLAAIVALRLVRRARGAGRRLAVEVLLGTDAVRNLIREGKTHQLRSAMQTGRASGMQTLDKHLQELADRGEILGERIHA